MYDRTANGREKDVRKNVAEMAATSFKEHVLTKVADERWRCVQRKVCEKCTGNGQVPQGEAFEQCKNCGGRGWYEPWTYGFYLVEFKGTVILTGDAGECIWKSGAETVDLAREDSYCLSKIVDARKDFYPEDMIAGLEFELAEIDKEIALYDEDDERAAVTEEKARRQKKVDLIEQLRDELKGGDLHSMRAYELLEDAGEGDCGETVSAAYGYASSHFWHVEALRTFIRLRDASGPA